MHTLHHHDINDLLEALRPSSILLIDPHPDALPLNYLATHPDCQVAHIQWDINAQLQDLARFDLGVVANTLEFLDHKTAGIILARLRDLYTRRFVALVPIGKDWEGQSSYWETADLLGYGMTIMARYQVDNKPLYLYHYAIETYKTTPEWFSSKHWANPHRWRP